jgi:tRNA (guanine-N7-)-methyltransferase
MDSIDSEFSDPDSHRSFRELIDETRFRQAMETKLPIELEIGSGKGLFLTNAARCNPEHFYIGLELAAKYAREAQAKLDRLKVQNAVFVASDATRVIATEVPEASVQAVHVYFPDPWWKAKHKKRRVLSDETLDGPFYVPEPVALHGMDYRTHFERRTRLNGLPVYRARFVRLA